MAFPNKWVSGEKITASRLNEWNDALAAFEKVSSTAAASRRTFVGFGTDAPQHPVHVNTAEAWKGFRAGRNDAPFFAVYSDTSGNGETVLSTAAGPNNVVLRASGDTVFNGGKIGFGAASPEVGVHIESKQLLIHFNDYGSWAMRFRGQKDTGTKVGEYDFIPSYYGLELVNPQVPARMCQFDPYGDVYPGRGLVCQAQTASPPNPSTGYVRLYLRGSKLVIQYNDAGTVRYKYLDLAGTGVTWVHTTTAP